MKTLKTYFLGDKQAEILEIERAILKITLLFQGILTKKIPSKDNLIAI